MFLKNLCFLFKLRDEGSRPQNQIDKNQSNNIKKVTPKD
jgi:hypothetical protein